MYQQDSQGEVLRRSRFLIEQVDFDQEPTQQQILERAQQLQIDDLQMAKESLTRPLDPEWKPYSNRSGNIYYINLEERKAYEDHPIDMLYQIEYAIKNKRKIPAFRQYQLEQVVKSMHLVERQISENIKTTNNLNIVYQESQEQSVRRQTKRTEEQESSGKRSHKRFPQQEQENIQIQLELQDEKQIENYRIEMKKIFESELHTYRKLKEQKYSVKKQHHFKIMEEIKQQQLSKMRKQIEEQIQHKNQVVLEKHEKELKNDYYEKLSRLDNLFEKEYELMKQLHCSSTANISKDLQISFSRRNLHKKLLLKNQLLFTLKRQKKQKMQSYVEDYTKLFHKQIIKINGGAQHYEKILRSSLISNLFEENKPTKQRKYSIFHEDRSYSTKVLQINDSISLKNMKDMMENNIDETPSQLKYGFVNKDNRFKNRRFESSIALKLFKKLM